MHAFTRIPVFKVSLAFMFLMVLTAAPGWATWRPDSLYMRDYGGPYSDDCWGLVNGPGGGFVFCGNTTSAEGGTSDVYLTCVDAWGNVLWTHTYGGPGYDVAQALVACTDGGYLIGGYSDSYGAGHHDFYAIRTDADGDTLWTRTYGGAGYDYAYAADLGAGAGTEFVLAGYTDSYGAGMGDVYLIGLDADGDTVWTRTYGMSQTEWAMAVRPTADGGYAVLGTTRSFGLGNDDFFFIKTDSGGNLVDYRSYGGSSDDNGEDLRQTYDGGYILVGGSMSFGPRGDVLVIKTKADFSIDWMQNLGDSEWDTGEAVIETQDHTFVVAGGLTYDGVMSYYVAELGPSGILQWADTYGGSSTDRPFAIVQTNDLGYMVSGRSYSFGDVTQALLVRLNGPLPLMRRVSDVPGDQGRQARISWFSSSYDYPSSPYDIYEYSIWRRIDEWSLSVRGAVPVLYAGLSYPPGKWDYVTTVPAMGEIEYNTVVPTLCDSTISEGMCYSTFCVMAHTSYPTYYLTSPVDSGYSVDNLAPAPPENLHMSSEAGLAWDEAPEEDFDYFAVYGSFDPDYAMAELIGYTVDTEMDVGSSVYDYYFVTATDFAGNEGDPAAVANTYADAAGGLAPAAFALKQNNPNPFSAGTAIGFDLPEYSHVTLEVIDIGGRLVTTLLDECRPAGRHSVRWDGRGATGAGVGPGIYFVRMTAGDFSATAKMMLLK
jgi:hypothetical protein